MGASLPAKKRRLLRLLRDVTLIAVISLVSGELALRIFHHFHPVYVFYDQSYNRFRGRPHAKDYSFELNSRGFKDVEYRVDKGQEFRILGIGDSFTYGVVPYEHNYLTVAESMLGEQHDHLEIINMGIPSIGPREYVEVLGAEGVELDPDMVLLSFFIGNDFLESVRKLERPLIEHSYVASLIRFAIGVRPRLQGQVIGGHKSYDDAAPTLAPETFLEIETWRSSICFQGLQDFQKLLDPTVSELRAFDRICRRHGIELMVVIIPDEFQVNPAVQDAILRKLDTTREASKVDFSRPNRMLCASLDELGVDYLDLLPAFRAAQEEQRLYKPQDTHWNIAGNRLAARLIANKVLTKVTGSGSLASLPGN